jgi:hypothetical protein
MIEGQQIEVRQRSSNGIGTASLVLGILACLVCWIPFLGILGIPVAIIGIVLAVIGFLIGLLRRSSTGGAVAGGTQWISADPLRANRGISMNSAAYHLEMAKIEEYAERYQKLGFIIEREVNIAGVVIDLIAKKGSDKICFEFIYRKNSSRKIQHLVAIGEAAKRIEASDFKVIVFDDPKQIDLEIEWIEEILFDVIESHEAESQLVDIGNGYEVNGIYLGEIHSIKLNEKEIRISGVGDIDIGIFIGPSRDGMTVTYNFPFDFDIQVDYNKKLRAIHSLNIDESEYYDNSDEEHDEIEEDPDDSDPR